jgi:hypothetical protein
MHMAACHMDANNSAHHGALAQRVTAVQQTATSYCRRVHPIAAMARDRQQILHVATEQHLAQSSKALLGTESAYQQHKLVCMQQV